MLGGGISGTEGRSVSWLDTAALSCCCRMAGSDDLDRRNNLGPRVSFSLPGLGVKGSVLVRITIGWYLGFLSAEVLLRAGLCCLVFWDAGSAEVLCVVLGFFVFS